MIRHLAFDAILEHFEAFVVFLGTVKPSFGDYLLARFVGMFRVRLLKQVGSRIRNDPPARATWAARISGLKLGVRIRKRHTVYTGWAGGSTMP